MQWVTLGALSGLIFGLSDVATKRGLTSNSVLFVLSGTFAFAFLFWLPVIGGMLAKGSGIDWLVGIRGIALSSHLAILLKSSCLAASSLLAFAAIKHLPLSIAGGIRATGPIWPLIGGILLFHEALTSSEWIGLVFVLSALTIYTVVGVRSGSSRVSTTWIAAMAGAVLLAGISLLLDKALVAGRDVDPRHVQFLSDFYRFVIVATAVWAYTKVHPEVTRGAHWHWGIAAGGIGMSLGEFVYFQALLDPQAIIGILSALRRVSVVTAFVFAVFVLKEDRIRAKSAAISLLIVGLAILAAAKS